MNSDLLDDQDRAMAVFLVLTRVFPLLFGLTERSGWLRDLANRLVLLSERIELNRKGFSTS